jgi:ribosome-associated translation inhibitor RaiA
MKIVFKNMKSSLNAQEIIKEKLEAVFEKFPTLSEHKVTLTVEMENSPRQAGPDQFTISTMVTGKVFKNLRIKKSSKNFYLTVTEVVNGFNKLLNRETERLFKNKHKSKMITGEIYE